MARRLAKEQDGRPTILPVPLDYREPFNYRLNVYLHQINWAYWGGPQDTERLIEELMLAVSGMELTINAGSPKQS